MREILLPIDPSTTLKPHSEERAKKSMLRVNPEHARVEHGVAEGLTEMKLVGAREGMTIF